MRAIDLQGETGAPCHSSSGGACYRSAAHCVATAGVSAEPPANTPCTVFTEQGTPHIETIFHEYGHHLDDKLRAQGTRPARIGSGSCAVGDANGEASAVSETIANAMTLAAYRKYWQGTQAFARDYSGATCFSGNRGCFYGMGPRGPIHMPGDHSSLMCLPKTCGPNEYNVGMGFIQAFWEAMFHRNCFNSPCYTLRGVGGRGYATKALFYASFKSPGLTTHRQLAGNFLNYYYQFVDQAAWEDLWWVFDHHGLIGGVKNGYSKCDGESPP